MVRIVGPILALLAADGALAQVVDEAPEPSAPATVPEKPPSADTPDADSPTKSEPADGDDIAPDSDESVIDPELMQLYLLDGSILAGKFSIEAITVETEFGTLSVPIESVRRFIPGLDSHDHLSERIGELISQLGGDDYAQRETAHRELVQMGPPVRKELEEHRESENAELSRRVKAILGQLEELAEETGIDGSSEANTAWIREDTVVTDQFTVVGRISPQSFTIDNRYGTLHVDLADIKHAQKPGSNEAEDVRRSLSLDGTFLAQLKFKSTGIRVSKGDKVTVTATGRISRSGSSSYVSGPDGSSRFSYYSQNPQILGGALVAKVGNGKVEKVGSKWTHTVSKDGMLRFAIGMRPDYVGRYQFIGQYSLKIKVERRRD